MRTSIYNDDRTKKTLLLTHGYAMSSVYYSRILPGLAKNFRIITFDNSGWGMNQRTANVDDALESPEKAERWLVSWFEKVVEALNPDLPDKFYLSGHSAGGLLCMLYAINHPERIDGLFLQSPAGVED